ncbi:23S rRNA (pseudouridine(1915)-N(3))-methyltransferase RlmH [Acidithiobacillus albertensis]|jgi:23S rRNA (pseudouridine1915-N3)-methyltransferase|uniref:23S rRNA (pseudouridine(1915)-N(3))-methyltransferase RlmH n=1 Tax=Acidithiobacillus albertensis TaxID=119978 RepID=UPI00094AE478|nr:23S rRNA (pseudouridine(1915)-N(3))-methyltransferase RlmH [Acidithiobacillus albertensis]
MRLRILAIGNKMPAWVESGVAEYAARMPPQCRVEWRALPMAKRGRSGDPIRWRREEGERIRSATPAGSEKVALEVGGKVLSSEALAQRMDAWFLGGRDVTFWIGGPDGLDPELHADWQWSLSALTMAHPVVRVVLAEQLYRAWSIQAGLPYHRGAEE